MSVWNLSSGVKDSTEPQETVKQDGQQDDGQVQQVNEPAEQGEKKIVLDGPLSSIYTQALNVLYAKEDMAGMFLPSIEKEEVDDNDLYVYCTPGEFVDGNLSEVADKITQASQHGLNVVAIECSSVIPSKMKLLEDLSRGLGVELYVTRRSALEAIQSKMRK